MGDLAPKARNTFFLRKFGVRERIFCISPPPEHLCGPYFKVTARTNNGTPPFCFYSVVSPIWQIGKKNVPKIVRFFRYSARSPHRATKPSRVWLRVIIRKLPLVLFALDRAANEVTAKARACWRGGVQGAGPGPRAKGRLPWLPTLLLSLRFRGRQHGAPEQRQTNEATQRTRTPPCEALPPRTPG